MKLSTRLVLLILGCLLPILAAQVYSQINLYRERHEQIGGLVLRQAELASRSSFARPMEMMPAEQPIPDRLYDLMSGLMPKWLTIMAERDGVGLNSEQLTITMSTCKASPG